MFFFWKMSNELSSFEKKSLGGSKSFKAIRRRSQSAPKVLKGRLKVWRVEDGFRNGYKSLLDKGVRETKSEWEVISDIDSTVSLGGEVLDNLVVLQVIATCHSVGRNSVRCVENELCLWLEKRKIRKREVVVNSIKTGRSDATMVFAVESVKILLDFLKVQ